MDAGVLTGALIALVSAAAGIWGALKVEDRKHRYEQWAYERSVLENLQDAAVAFSRSQGAVLTAWRKGEFGTPATKAATADLLEEVSRTWSAFSQQRSRVANKDVRLACIEFVRIWHEVDSHITSHRYQREEWATHTWRLSKQLSVVLERSGDLIQSAAPFRSWWRQVWGYVRTWNAERRNKRAREKALQDHPELRQSEPIIDSDTEQSGRNAPVS